MSFGKYCVLFLVAAAPAAGLAAESNGSARVAAAVVPAADSNPTFRAGAAALDDGLYELAEKQFRAYLKTSPDADAAEEAAVFLARALYGQKKYAAILAAVPAPGRAAAAAFWRATAQYELKQRDKALAELADFENREGASDYAPDVLRLRARCYAETGRLDDALVLYERVGNEYGEVSDAGRSSLERAELLLSVGRTNEAGVVLDTLTNRAPDSVAGQEAALMKGRILALQGLWNDAESLLFDFAGRKDVLPENRTRAAISLSEAYDAQGKFNEATNGYLRVMETASNPGLKTLAATLYGRCLLRNGKTEAGAAVLGAVIAAAPQDPAAGGLQLAIADAFLDAGVAARAAEEYQKYLDTFSDKGGKARALSGKGWALWLMAEPQYDEAATAFRQAYEISDDPGEKAQCLVKSADSQFRGGRFTLAAQTYERVAAEFPDSPLISQTLFQRAESTARAGKTDEAMAMFASLAEKKDAGRFAEQALLRVAEIREDLGNLPEALEGYSLVMENYTNGALFVNALLGRGLVNYRMLRFETALADFESLLQVAPPSDLAERAFYMRGWCCQMLGRDGEALAICKEFAEKFEASRWRPAVLFWIGEYLFNRGDYTEAERWLLTLVNECPRDPLAERALLWAGEAASKQKEYRRAAEHFAALVEKFPAGTMLVRARCAQGDAMAELGEYANAILFFEDVINRNPTNGLADIAWMRKGDCEFAMGRTDAKRFESAMSCYRAVAENEAATPELRLQAHYKIGNCLGKLDRPQDALEQYYTKVILAYTDDRARSMRRDPASEVWFTRAAFDVVEMLGAQKRWREAAKVLKRVVDANVAASGEARKRMEELRLRHWIILY